MKKPSPDKLELLVENDASLTIKAKLRKTGKARAKKDFVEMKLIYKHCMPSFYHRYVDNTITIKPNLESAQNFFNIFINCHQSFNFTMECEIDGKLPFLGMEAI